MSHVSGSQTSLMGPEWRRGTVGREIVISQAEGVKMSGRARQIMDCRKELLRVNRRVGNVE